MITAWSLSRLKIFEQCPARAKLQFSDKIGYDNSTTSEQKRLRGIVVHEGAEKFVTGETDKLPTELNAFKAELAHLRSLYDVGCVLTEDDWAFDADWQPTTWNSPTAWLRLKLDAIVFDKRDPTHAVVIDYKTGRRAGNEISHREQGILYAVTAMLRHPELELVTVEFWYVDKDELTSREVRRSELPGFIKNFERRGHALTSAESFPATPSQHACRWCPYRHTPHCSAGL